MKTVTITKEPRKLYARTPNGKSNKWNRRRRKKREHLLKHRFAKYKLELRQPIICYDDEELEEEIIKTIITEVNTTRND